jgi:PAS domain S-box-containing protein
MGTEDALTGGRDTLYEVGERLSGTAGLREVLEETLRRVIDLLRADAGAIFVVDEPARELVLSASLGLSERFAAQEARLPIGTCMCGLSVEGADTLYVVEDARAEPRCVIGNCMEDGFRSLLCLPLRAGGKVWGLLRLHGRGVGAFGRQESSLLVFIGSQLGMAIQRMRLQEQIDQLLRRAETERATLDSLMRSLVDGLVLVDGEGRVVYWNPSAERYLGLGAAEVVGQGLEAVLAHLRTIVLDPEQKLEELRRALAEVPSRPQVEFLVTTPAPRTLEARFFPIEGREGSGIVLRNVTAERQLDEMKSQLLSTVSHELRTPLASIKGFATTLLRDDVQWEPAAQREFLQIIDQEADRLNELIANLLAMSRLEAGVLRMDLGRVELAPLIAEVLAGMELRAQGLTLAADVPGDLPAVWADDRRVRQVLHNLIDNALKYSGSGEVTVRARHEGDVVHVSVSDQGIGIAPDQLGRIFERFYQVAGAAARRAGGVGLGLSICKGIIEAHGGRIWAESTPGRGSTFHFTLPLQPPSDGDQRGMEGAEIDAPLRSPPQSGADCPSGCLGQAGAIDASQSHHPRHRR